MDQLLTAALGALAAIGGWRYLAAFLGIFGETTLFVGLVVPGDAVVLLTSTPNRTVGDWALSMLAVVAGSLCGESLGWLIGRRAGARLRRSRLGRLLGETAWQRAEDWVRRRGGVAILLSRFLPVLHALVPVTSGASGFPYRRFLAWTAPACTLWAAVYVTVGTVAGSSYATLARTLHSAGWIVLGAVVVFLVVAWLAKKLLSRAEPR